MERGILFNTEMVKSILEGRKTVTRRPVKFCDSGHIKYKGKNVRKPEYVHTLNGSGVALARLVIAILEIHQNQDGSVNIPKALRPFMDGLKRIKT